MKLFKHLLIYIAVVFLCACGGGGGRYSSDDQIYNDDYHQNIQYENELNAHEAEAQEAEIEKLRQQVSDYEQYQEDMNQHIEELKYKSQQVDNQLNRFQTDNWRDVVPDVVDAQEDLYIEFNNAPIEP
ncbi:Uncharacterised protein [Neisseria animaloris]|uniref:hypothetical protein n=1 Tax=Neisseria animaloris TaxID=326522 RepID=UPI000A1986C5|nr:hypothetical protein [Neisseria animaloris]OSI07389.1 hypothetical protein BWD08_07525 [Neisseria animaloris]VEH87774.1 Uncharacterised protein [Neisseria animaloris]